MQAQDAQTLILIKFWPWVIANTKQLIAAAVGIAIIVFAVFFYTTHQSQKEIDAGNALSHAMYQNRGADTLLKVAADYPGTRAGQRALLEGAQSLFVVGRYSDAEVQFRKFLDTYPDSEMIPNAFFGQAASLESQGKLDQAATIYQKVSNQSTSLSAAIMAKFALARIDTQQGKIADAEKIYEDIARQSQNSPYAQEAAMRAMELRTGATASTTRTPSATASTNTVAPAFQLTH